VGCQPEEVGVEMAVEAVYDDVTPEITLVKFQPAKAPSQAGEEE
jgi:hypothetical protein